MYYSSIHRTAARIAVLYSEGEINIEESEVSRSSFPVWVESLAWRSGGRFLDPSKAKARDQLNSLPRVTVILLKPNKERRDCE